MCPSPSDENTRQHLADYRHLMRVFSRPRPPGSRGEQATFQSMCAWLQAREIPYRVHAFPLYPYFFEAIGVWIMLSRALLLLAVILRWGWGALLIALISLLGGTLDILFGLPFVTWPGRGEGKNIVMQFDTPKAEREIVLTAHYDSKTELLDHRQRRIFVERTRFWVALTLAVGVLAVADRYFYLMGLRAAVTMHTAGVGFALMVAFAALGLGLHLTLGRVITPSQGAVDNGAACAVILKLAERLSKEGVPSPHTRVTLVLFTGEEANMQGSRAYVRSRDWRLPTRVVNLELLGQDGPYVLWVRDGDAFHRVETPAALRAWVNQAVQEVTGEPAQEEDLINSDAFSFLRQGIPAVTLGTRHSRWGTRGLHRPTDNLSRITLPRLVEHEAVLWRLLGGNVRREA